MITVIEIKLILIALAGLLFFCVNNAHGQNSNDTCLSQQDSLLHKKVYLSVTSQPSPKEDFSSFLNSVAKHLETTNSLRNDVQYYSRVLIAFVVEENGRIDGVRVIHNKQGIAPVSEKSVVDYFKLYTNKWQPAVCNGKPVPFLFIVPLVIDIQQ
jgi:hypothetical protein